MENPTITAMEPVTKDSSALPLLNEPGIEQAPPRRPYVDLYLISFLILFFELACIRWFASTVVFLTFFTNIVLLACFLGMSVGLLTAKRRQNYIRWVLPLSFLAVALAMISYNLYLQYWNKITITVGNQTGSPGLIYFGTEYRPPDPSRLLIPVWAVAGLFFTLIAMIFIGLGQTMGRAFDAITNRIGAYTTDVLGSLTGIAAFGAMSKLQLSPLHWFLVVVLVIAYFVRRWNYIQILSAVGVIFLMGISAFVANGNPGERNLFFWSPYYKVAYDFKTGAIDTNNISHQQMVEINKDGPAYLMPHLINRDAGNAPFENIMIIGAGSGNDVAAALHFKETKRVDAVEIDPAINLIGQTDHPDNPYQDPRVNGHIHWTDGRRFASRPVYDEVTGKEVKYDLAVYALVDSLVLHSGYSSLRLENFLFTEQAFRDIKARLKPGGVFAMYNYYRQGWVVGRLFLLAKKVFGTEPVVISMPFQPEIHPGDNLSGKTPFRTFLLVGENSDRLKAIKKKFETDKNFWINWHPSESDNRNGYAADAPEPGPQWLKISPATVDTTGITDKDLPTDDWPQLYLKEHAIPKAPTQQGMLTIAVLSIVILLGFGWPVWFGKDRVGSRSNGQMFFLGAGFMLLETKGVVHMALLFGSTWIVNSVVFFAILVMILIANLFTMAVRPRKLWPYYLLLIAALLVNAFVEMDWFLVLPGVWRMVASCGIVFLPVFFAGVIFATSFRDSKNPDVDFGSNVAGIILGGLSEQLSLIIGFKFLLLVAIGYYAPSALLRKRPDEPMDEDREKQPLAIGEVAPA